MEYKIIFHRILKGWEIRYSNGLAISSGNRPMTKGTPNITSKIVLPEDIITATLHKMIITGRRAPDRNHRDIRLELSNNRAERSIKPFVIGRKNWMTPLIDVAFIMRCVKWVNYLDSFATSPPSEYYAEVSHHSDKQEPLSPMS
jgi:hypothetical protein